MIPYGHQSINEDDIAAVEKVLRSDRLTTGPCVPAFEKALCECVGARYAVVVNSGTSALDLAVNALALPIGSEVITTPFTFAATSNALLFNGLIPVYADVEPDTRNISPDSIRERITPKTRAILTVDYAGHPCSYESIWEIAEEFDLFLIDDACHALGASHPKGRLADLTTFSFHPVKPITTGEGGAVVTDDPEYASRMRLHRSHGITREGAPIDWQYDMLMLGRNYRMTDLQAALGISQLKRLGTFIQRRNELAAQYNELLSREQSLKTPTTRAGYIHGWHLYTMLLDGIDRDRFFHSMRKQGVGVNVHYIPTYRLSYYRDYRFNGTKGCPVTESLFKRIITLPLHPGMTNDDVETVAVAVHTAIKEAS